jgi:Na+-translocating ferredoxin:NAD+ oxidoreductase subunit G
MKNEVIQWHDHKEPSLLKLILTLTLAGLLSGIAIVGIYEITLPTITAYKAKMLRQAVFNVLPGVEQIEKLRYHEGRLQASTSEESAVETVYAGYDSTGQLIGYAITGEGPGFQDTIRILYGYLPDKRQIVGMAVLESRETPGLGDKIYKDADFQENFKALSVDPTISMVKKGSKTAANQVDAISGATISSKAIVKIINQSNEQWLKRLSQKEES